MQKGESGIPCVAVKCVDIWRNTGGESGLWSVTDAEAQKRGEPGLDTLVVYAVNECGVILPPSAAVNALSTPPGVTTVGLNSKTGPAQAVEHVV